MIPATDEQIREVCATRSAPQAVAYLKQQGLSAGQNRCEDIISIMIDAGERKPPRYQFPTATPEWADVRRAEAEIGCRRLLAAQLRTGAHWIHDRGRMAVALREAWLAP